MKPRPRKPKKQAALSALANSLRPPLTNLSALSQTLASGRVGGRMIREYVLMCALEASKVTRLLEMFVTKELQVRPNPPGTIGNLNAPSANELDGYASSFAQVRPGRPGPKKKSLKSTAGLRVTPIDAVSCRQQRSVPIR